MQPILVIEDDAQFRETLRSVLEDEGWPVETAGDGQQALDQSARLRPALVVLDWGLPDIDSQVVATSLRTMHGGDIPILLITADGRPAEKARQMGAFAYLHKPFELDDLIEIVRRGLGNR
jgi:two-component system response regulator MprA